MDQKFISGNFLPPPRGYPPIALLNNGHDGHHPALSSSDFFHRPSSLLEIRLIEILLPFPGLKLVSSRQEEGWEEGGGRGNTSFLHQSSLAGSSGAVLTGQHSRLTDLPATPHSPQFPTLQNIPLNFLLPINTFSCPRKRPSLQFPLDPFLEKLETAPTSKAIGAGVLLKLDPS